MNVKRFLSAGFVFALAVSATFIGAQAQELKKQQSIVVSTFKPYKYANAEAEYVIELPDAPTGRTIWAQDGDVPFILNAPKYGAMGEVATLKRVDLSTGDIFDVEIIFVKADRDFLLSLTEADVEKELRDRLSVLHLQNDRFRMSKGKDTLKWGTYSGFSVSRSNEILYNIAHYLTGLESVMLVRVSYNVHNETFNSYYKTLAKSIQFMGK